MRASHKFDTSDTSTNMASIAGDATITQMVAAPWRRKRRFRNGRLLGSIMFVSKVLQLVVVGGGHFHGLSKDAEAERVQQIRAHTRKRHADRQADAVRGHRGA